MSSRPEDDEQARTPSKAQLLSIIATGRDDDPRAALTRLNGLVPQLESNGPAELLLIGLAGRAELTWRTESPLRDVTTTCDLLEQAARERLEPLWIAFACALRATACLDAGDVAGSMADLARVDLDQLGDALAGPGGGHLLDLLADTYGRLRLHQQVDGVRNRAEQLLSRRPPVDRAAHWAHRATELAAQALEPVAAGAEDPDLRLLQQAAEYADQLSTVPPDLVPDRLRRGADAVRALEAAFRGRPAESLRLLGEDGFHPPNDLPGLERRLAMIAAIHAQALIGAVDAARQMDDDLKTVTAPLPCLVLDVCQAQERLRLETRNDGDPGPVLERLAGLLVRLGWAGMELVSETARQALEHQALRVENRTDALTGVGNRRALDEELRSMLRFSPLPLSLVLVDVDHFKAVNDRYTHIVGDEVLRRVATTLSGQLRGGDRLVRYGGDEFVVLLPLTSDTEAEAVATRMVEAVGELDWRKLADGLQVRITTGCGTLWSLSHRRPDGDAEYLFRLADEQLLQAKQRRNDPLTGPLPPGHLFPTVVTPAPPPSSPPPPSPPPPSPSSPAPRRVDGPRRRERPRTDPEASAPPLPPAARPAEAVTSLTELLEDPLASGGRATAANLQLPFSPAGGLPLYQALLQDPPRVDPHLGFLPPRGLTRFTVPDAFTRPGPEPEPPAPNSSAGDGDPPARGHASERSRSRPRRRPKVIDLTMLEKRRSPFG